MSRYRFAIDNATAHLRSLWLVIGLQMAVIAGLSYGWSRAPEHLTVHIPPDLRSGAMQHHTAVPAATVYAFAFYIFQQLNRWPEDGSRDYGHAIFRIAPYVTPRHRAELLANLEEKGRQVWLDLELLESVKGMTVKRTRIRYPLRVVRYAVDPETNPWGLALDGFGADGPRRLTEADLLGEGTAHAAQ